MVATMTQVPNAAAVEFRAESDERAVLRLSYEPSDLDFGTLVVEIRAAGLTCDADAPSARGDGLDSFLADLALDWRGWDGTRRCGMHSNTP